MEMETETGSIEGHESESDSSIPAIDLLPPEMLQSIYEFLPFSDLLACREVNKRWKSVATDPVRKRCASVAFSRRDIPKSQRSRAIQSFNQLIRATNQQEEFPVTEFWLDLNSDYYWIEMDGSTLICQFLETVRPFVKHIVFEFGFESLEVPKNCLALDLTFPNLTEITFKLFEHQNKDSETFSFVRKIIQKCPNIKEFHLHLHKVTRSGAVRRCILETGIKQKASLVTSLIIEAPRNERDFAYLNKLGFKLKYFRLHLIDHNVSPEIFSEFLESQSDTLTYLGLSLGNRNNYQCFRELPCLPHLKNLSVSVWNPAKKAGEQFPTLFYKTQLPALERLNLSDAEFAVDYLVASHMAPSQSLRELIFPVGDIEDAGGVIRQAARLFPNLKKLKVFHQSIRPYMSDIYEALPGIEELCISTEGFLNVDDVVTGLPGRLLHKVLDNKTTPSYNLSKALAMLERGTTETLASLENLKVLMIYKEGNISYVNQGEDFTELSGVVLKQMKGLQRIDFGVRKYGPNVSEALKQDLETHGIKLFHRRPSFIRSRTDFVVTDDSEIDSD